MILLAIPNWVNYIVIEMDKSVWAHRYDPRKKGQPAVSRTKSIMLGKYHKHDTKIPTGTTKLQSIVNKEERFFNDTMEIVTRDNRAYKAFALEAFLLDRGIEEKEKAQKVGFKKAGSFDITFNDNIFTKWTNDHFNKSLKEMFKKDLEKNYYDPTSWDDIRSVDYAALENRVAASKITVDGREDYCDTLRYSLMIDPKEMI